MKACVHVQGHAWWWWCNQKRDDQAGAESTRSRECRKRVAARVRVEACERVWASVLAPVHACVHAKEEANEREEPAEGQREEEEWSRRRREGHTKDWKVVLRSCMQVLVYAWVLRAGTQEQSWEGRREGERRRRTARERAKRK